MKVIDLLNKIANGEEVPKKIKFDNKEYENEPCYMLYEATGDRNELQFKGFLNNEVEIIEEPQEHKIPEKIFLEDMYSANEIKVIDIELENKINEILDYLEEIE